MTDKHETSNTIIILKSSAMILISQHVNSILSTILQRQAIAAYARSMGVNTRQDSEIPRRVRVIA